MESLHLAHLTLLLSWAGVLLAEFVVELTARDENAIRHAARTHFWIDMVIELPLLLGILATGGLLAWRAWPLGGGLLVKIGCALIALGANLVCVGLVVVRHRARDDARQLLRYHARVRLTGLGIPFGLVAAYLGFVGAR
jgi:hypothetical protein